MDDRTKKPCYLFALVARPAGGARHITAQRRRLTTCGCYVRPGDMDKTEHAMNSLIASVAWGGALRPAARSGAFHDH
jgi:aminopeptidase N